MAAAAEAMTASSHPLICRIRDHGNGNGNGGLAKRAESRILSWDVLAPWLLSLATAGLGGSVEWTVKLAVRGGLT